MTWLAILAAFGVGVVGLAYSFLRLRPTLLTLRAEMQAVSSTAKLPPITRAELEQYMADVAAANDARPDLFDDDLQGWRNDERRLSAAVEDLTKRIAAIEKSLASEEDSRKVDLSTS